MDRVSTPWDEALDRVDGRLAVIAASRAGEVRPVRGGALLWSLAVAALLALGMIIVLPTIGATAP